MWRRTKRIYFSNSVTFHTFLFGLKLFFTNRKGNWKIEIDRKSLSFKCLFFEVSFETSIFFKVKKYLPHYKPIPVMKTGFSLWTFSHREKPVFITGIPAMRTGFPVMKTGFSLWEELHMENPVFSTGMGLQCDKQKTRA